MIWSNKIFLSALFPIYCFLTLVTASLYCEDKSIAPEKVNAPLHISFRFVDQFGRSASGIKAAILWSTMVGLKGANGSIVFTSDPQSSKKMILTADQNGTIVYEGSEPCPGGIIIIEDNNFITEHWHFGFALTDYFGDKTYDLFNAKKVHIFNKDNPEKVAVWRRMGFKSLALYMTAITRLILIPHRERSASTSLRSSRLIWVAISSSNGR